jgi:hypothetical protein
MNGAGRGRIAASGPSADAIVKNGAARRENGRECSHYRF